MEIRRRPGLAALAAAIFRAVSRFANETHSQQQVRFPARRRRCLALAVLAVLLPAVFSPFAAHAQQQGSTCSDLNRTIFPWYLGRADNHVYICDGSAFQTLLTATESPMQIGLGTTSPGAGLDVQFPETASGGVAYGVRYQQTLTAAANGDNLTALYINPTFTNGSYTGVANNGLIVASGNVGIGTASPANALDVNGGVGIGTYAGTATTSGNLVVSGNVGIGTASPSYPLDAYFGTNQGEFAAGNLGFNSIKIGNTKNGPLGFMTSNAVRMALGPTGGFALGSTFYSTDPGSGNAIFQGNVGIGSTSPAASLDLSQKTDAIALPVGTTGQRPGSPANGMLRYNSTVPQVEAYYSGAWQPLGSGSGGGTITLGTSASVTNPQRSGDATTGLFSATTGTVSIAASGTDEADFVSTGLNLPVATESYKISNVNALWQDNTNFNTAVGDTAFPTTVSQTGGGTNGQSDTALGYQALNANTTGANNTAIGYSALQVNTTGYQNTAVGSWALQANTTGVTNVAMGYKALVSNTGGSSNTAVGNADFF